MWKSSHCGGKTSLPVVEKQSLWRNELASHVDEHALWRRHRGRSGDQTSTFAADGIFSTSPTSRPTPPHLLHCRCRPSRTPCARTTFAAIGMHLANTEPDTGGLSPRHHMTPWVRAGPSVSLHVLTLARAFQARHDARTGRRRAVPRSVAQRKSSSPIRSVSQVRLLPERRPRSSLASPTLEARQRYEGVPCGPRGPRRSQ